jgi:hypothetical protein
MSWLLRTNRSSNCTSCSSKPRQHYLPQGITAPGGRGCGEEIRSASGLEDVGLNFHTLFSMVAHWAVDFVVPGCESSCIGLGFTRAQVGLKCFLNPLAPNHKVVYSGTIIGNPESLRDGRK